MSLLCKECFGVTYLQYIQTKRIRKAEELLRERQYTLTEVCAMCGYTNQLTFRRNFKSITGVNPSTYQEKQNER
nr:AraC family transcriptional regulator [uncultured Acetatifactor sp.]